METWVSGPGLEADHARVSGEQLTARTSRRAPRAATPQAQATLDRHAGRLARGLAHVVNIFDPGRDRAGRRAVASSRTSMRAAGAAWRRTSSPSDAARHGQAAALGRCQRRARRRLAVGGTLQAASAATSASHLDGSWKMISVSSPVQRELAVVDDRACGSRRSRTTGTTARRPAPRPACRSSARNRRSRPARPCSSSSRSAFFTWGSLRLPPGACVGRWRRPCRRPSRPSPSRRRGRRGTTSCRPWPP